MKVLGGGALGGAVLTVVSFLVAGWRWPVAYAALLSNPITNPGAEIAPNLRPLLHAAGMTWIAGILVSGLAWRAWLRSLPGRLEQPS